MNWAPLLDGMSDELGKIAEFNLRGVSPQTVIEKGQPAPPMETPGFDKARDILTRASMAKTAASRHVRRALPLQPGVGKLTHQGDDSANEKAKSVAGYGLAGLGTGGALHKAYSMVTPGVYEGMHHPDLSAMQKYTAGMKNNRIGAGLAVGGTALGAGYGLYRQHQKAQASKKAEMVKTSTLSSPGMALKASQQIGKKKISPSISGPSTTTQIRGQLIGKKGIP